ncbi:ABC transporter permease [Aureimonas populi]|uniref:ABC transporter permease n=1 Tax=Aureimonas populi TaxID=1701758 RepID=A0ABW5CSM4_9HYPH|nr:ABC transporter permease [Aureimonas populi]
MSAVTQAVARPARGAARAALWIRPLLGAVVFLAAVEAIVVLLGIRPYYLPRPSAVFGAIAATPQTYAQGFARTLAEALLGFLAGSLFGVAAGIAFFRSQLLREMFFPLFIVSQTIPVIAFGAIVVLWFGNTLFAKAAIAFYLSFFPVTVNTLIGFGAVDPRQAALMRSFGAGERQLMRRLYLPAAMPQIFVALRLASSLSLVGAIVGEWFGDTTGLGVLLLQAMYNENVTGIWAAIVVSAVLGIGFYGTIALIERGVVFWGNEQ